MFTLNTSYPGGDKSFETMLDALSESRIFSIEKNDDGSIVLVEACDEFFRVICAPEQIRALAHELPALVD
jgi:hypothetical protein